MNLLVKTSVFTGTRQSDKRYVEAWDVTEGRTDGRVNISLRNFVGEGINKKGTLSEMSEFIRYTNASHAVTKQIYCLNLIRLQILKTYPAFSILKDFVSALFLASQSYGVTPTPEPPEMKKKCASWLNFSNFETIEVVH